MKELKHEVIINGTPQPDNMPKEDFTIFCTALLSLVEDYYKEKRNETEGEDTPCFHSFRAKKNFFDFFSKRY